MPLLKVQLNHPGSEKPFKLGYQKVNGSIIREWNDDPCHYRKFIRNKGDYLSSIGANPIESKLQF